MRAHIEGSAAPTPYPDPLDSSLFFDRDLSLIRFQWRVLEEARDRDNPLLERVKFLSILGSNIDEFLMIRAAELDDTGGRVIGIETDGVPASVHREDVLERVRALLREARSYLRNHLIPELAQAGIHIVPYTALSDPARTEANSYFKDAILPILTPIAFDPSRPFPHITNLSMNLAILIRDDRGVERFAYLRIPSAVPQFVRLTWPSTNSGIEAAHRRETAFVWLEEVITANLPELFPGMQIAEAHRFRITRNAHLPMQDWEPSISLDAIQEGIRQRDFAPIVALLVDQEMSSHLMDVLTHNLDLSHKNVFRAEVVLPLARLMELWRLDRPDLHDPPLKPSIPQPIRISSQQDMFSCIRQQDLMLHHPFDSFQPVIRFLEQAAEDPDVLAIKITLYRVGPNSPVVKALLVARRNGKQVTVVVELKARFDEENNVAGARTLEDAGAQVVYSNTEVKIHAKVCLVVRQEGERVRSYVHLSSGNYNAATASVYTDIGLLTCNDAIAADTADLFNVLTGFASPANFRRLLVAPVDLRERIRDLILREIGWARNGVSTHLVFKMNALVDKETIRLLYAASDAGVQVDLIVRGICCLRPRVAGVSERIRVRSIVGRFLEHSRVFYFRNGGDEEIYIGSADLMPRNLDRRVEVLFPIHNSGLRQRLRHEILDAYLNDNTKARELQSDGSYTRIRRQRGELPSSSQQQLLTTWLV